jgi:peptidoglycan hydrolase-like protein with peptidoglycan-binding domain
MRRSLPVIAAVAMSLIPAADAMASGYASRTLAMGSSGSDVRALQRYLDRTGYETGVDGEFGRGTRTSFMSFERAEGRRANGRASRSEQRLLRKRASGEESGDETDTSTEGGAGYDETAPATEAAGEDGYVDHDGLAVAPASAPQEVKDIIAAGNKIARKPYKYGGGHGRWRDSGYDCSGSVSYALHAAGLLDAPLASGGFMTWENRGRGEWVTIRANAGHAYMIVAGLRFDTSARKLTGSRWSEQMRSARGYAGRHPEGL